MRPLSSFVTLSWLASSCFVWAQTPLWRTFYQKQQVLKIQTQTPNLDRVCGDYEQAVVDGSGKTDLAVGDVDVLRRETSAWSCDINRRQRGVDWQMKIDDARSKLTSVYPKIKL